MGTTPSGIFVHRFFPRWLGDSRSSNTPAKIDPSNQTLPAMVPRRTSKPSDRSKVDNIPKETVSPEQSIQNIQPIGRTIVAAVEKSPEDTTADISKSFSVGTKQDFKGDATAKLKSLQKDPQTVLKNTEQDTRLPVSPSPPPESAKLKQLSPPIPDFDVSWTPVVPVVPLHPPISPFPRCSRTSKSGNPKRHGQSGVIPSIRNQYSIRIPLLGDLITVIAWIFLKLLAASTMAKYGAKNSPRI